MKEAMPVLSRRRNLAQFQSAPLSRWIVVPFAPDHPLPNTALFPGSSALRDDCIFRLHLSVPGTGRFWLFGTRALLHGIQDGLVGRIVLGGGGQGSAIGDMVRCGNIRRDSF